MELFEQFLTERKYLKNVSKHTLIYYGNVRRAFRPILAEPTKAGMLECIQNLLASGVSPTSVNTYLRGFKAYCLWLKAENRLKEVFKVQFLKTEQKILPTMGDVAIRSLLAYKPKGRNATRAHLVALTILDTGLRASEVLGLTREQIDMDNLIFKVLGKGGKHRLIPFSSELRKLIFRHIISINICFSRKPIFSTKNNTKVSVRNLERDFQVLGQKVGITGIRFSPHTLRHTMAVNWIKKGGDIYMLSRILGHSNIATTTVYLRSLGVSDIQPVHARLSLLSTSGG